ncbi:hypothetical protein BS78_05G019200 [Paspalum vaginatum]|nr:hypothetical protein BS78_05G019200 [Paspalum vaginatum]
MGRVHPNPAPEPASSAATTSSSPSTPGEQQHESRAGGEEEEPAVSVLTVWRKSLLFGCHGFTVFDARGDLAFRVDCYASRRRADVVLMGAAGEPLLTVRRARRLGGLLAAERWVIYAGDGQGSAATPLLSALAHVTPLAGASGAGGAAEGAGYVVEGSYGRRACAVRDARGGGAAVAEVRRKEAVGDDVFRLVAGPRLGAPLAMGLVIALDEMFGARSSARRASSLLRRTWSA